MNYLKINSLFILLVLAFAQKSLAQSYSLNDLCNLCIKLNEDDNLYDLRDNANRHGFYSDELQGIYRSTNSNELHVSKYTHSGWRKDISVTYRFNSIEVESIKKEFAENCYFNGMSDDKKDAKYISNNGRFEFSITKTSNNWEVRVYEGDKNGFLHLRMARKTAPNLLEINSYTNWSKVVINKGDKVYIHVTGSVVTGEFSGATGPQGKNWSNIWNIVPNLKYGALLMTIGDAGTWQATGEDAIYVAPKSGRLRFTINDTDPTDNEGSFTVAYSINKPLPGTPIPTLIPVDDKDVQSNAGSIKENRKSVSINRLMIDSHTDITEIIVTRGDQIHLRATGTVATGAFSGVSGPEGKQWVNNWNIVPNINYGALLVTVGTNNPWQAVGEETTYVVPETGKLRLAINDTDPSDNSGSFAVEYRIIRASANAATAVASQPAASQPAAAPPASAPPAARPTPVAPATPAPAARPAPNPTGTSTSRNARFSVPNVTLSGAGMRVSTSGINIKLPEKKAAMPVANASTPATDNAPAGSSTVVQTITVTARWTMKKTDWNMPCTMTIDIDRANNAWGVINWSVGQVDRSVASQYQGKMNATAKEFVTGTYDPAMKILHVKGTSEDDPTGIIELDAYELSLLNGNAVMGKTATKGTWRGNIMGLYRLQNASR